MTTMTHDLSAGFLSLRLTQGEVLKAELHDSGSITLPDGSAEEHLPPFYAVSLLLHPSPTSQIRAELWLPVEGWNGRFLGTGNSGGGTRIIYRLLADGVRRGYATANTVLGNGPDEDAAIGDPEGWADFGHRATHGMTVVSKEVVAAFYGTPARYAYFVGSSTGGQQALATAQRYPEDYDGIISGVPAKNRTLLHAYFLWNYRALHTADGTPLFQQEQVRALSEAAVAYFHPAQQGTWPKPTFIPDPRAAFAARPGTTGQVAEEILRLARERDRSLTDAHAAAIRLLYAGPVNPRTGERIYGPMPFGSELTNFGILRQQDTRYSIAHLYTFRWAFGQSFDFLGFDFDQDLDRYNHTLAPYVNANDADLTAFQRRGGKLLMYSGSADPLVPYHDALSYYERVVAHQQGLEKTQSFFRYFLMPGMGH
ncbi:MAG: tannase/feruloyl esterase family alpha/beta hydrolase, partial [Eubacteriales bacterium]